MNNKKKINVLVVDDSIVFRKMLVMGISTDSSLNVVATASDSFSARDKIIEFEPDVMTLDIEMPVMDGIEFLKKLMPQYPFPVIVISSASERVFDALNAGAVDYIIKPDMKAVKTIEPFFKELIAKIKTASLAKVKQVKTSNLSAIGTAGSRVASRKIIAIGASTGGTEAIASILRCLPCNMPGIVIAQHMPPVFTQMFANRLNRLSSMEVREAKDGDKIIPGLALVAPGEHHMRIIKSGNAYYVECFEGPKHNGHRPSIDILFESVALNAGNEAIGVLLTGMGYDGAKGLQLMKKKGARTIGQDEASCVVYGMPKVAYNIGAVEKVCSIEELPGYMCSLVRIDG